MQMLNAITAIVAAPSRTKFGTWRPGNKCAKMRYRLLEYQEKHQRMEHVKPVGYPSQVGDP